MDNFSLSDSRTLIAVSVGISMIILGIGGGAAAGQLPVGGIVGLLLGVAVMFFLFPSEGQSCSPSDSEKDDNADEDSYELVWNDDDKKYDCLPTKCAEGYELDSSNVCVEETTSTTNSTPTKLEGDTCTTYTGPTLNSTANVLSYQLDSNLACNVVVCDTANGYTFSSANLQCELTPSLDCTGLTSADQDYKNATIDWNSSNQNKVRDFVEDVSLGICVAKTCINDNFLYNGVCYPTNYSGLVTTGSPKNAKVLQILNDSNGNFLGDVICNTEGGYFYNDAGECKCDLGYGFTSDSAGNCDNFSASNITYENLELVAYQYLGSNATSILSNIYIARDDSNNNTIFELLDNVNYSNLYIDNSPINQRIDISAGVDLSTESEGTQGILETNGKVGLLHIHGIYDPDGLLDDLANVIVDSDVIKYDVGGDTNNYKDVSFDNIVIDDLEDLINEEQFTSFTMSYTDGTSQDIATIDTKEKAIVLYQYLVMLGYFDSDS